LSICGVRNTGCTSRVAAGPNDGAFALIDYTNPASPTHTTFNSGTGGVIFNGPLNVDVDTGRAAVGDNGSGNLFFFDVTGSNAAPLGTQMTVQAGIFSVSISGTTVAAASSNNVAISLVSFINPNSPTEGDINSTGLNGGANVKLKGNRLAAGDILGTEVALFNVAGTSSTLLGKANTTLASIATIGFASFASPPPAAHIEATPSSLAFGAVHVGLGKSLPVSLKNTGNASLTITNRTSPSPQRSVRPAVRQAALPRGSADLEQTLPHRLRS
jgi:hypothetical protein